MNTIKSSGATTVSDVYTRWLPIVLIVAIIAHYFWYVFRYALNVPYQDDIYDVLGFLSEIVAADDWRTTLQLFFIRWNEHSTAASRLMYYLTYRVQGEVSFVTLIALANMSLVVFIGLLYLRVRELEYRWLILLPAALILFQFRTHYVSFWSTAAMAFFYALVYGCCAIYCLHRANAVKLLFAILFATLATHSLASGQLIWAVGLATLLHQVFISKRLSGFYLLWWILAAAVVVTLWYSPALSHPDVYFENLRNMSAAEAKEHAEYVAKVTEKPLADALMIQLKYFLVLLGSVTSDSSVPLAMLTGAIFLAALLYFSAVAVRGEDIRLELCWGYVAITVAAVAYGRAEIAALDYALNSRYGVMSVLMLSMAWVLLAIRLKLRNLPMFVLAVSLALAFSVNSYSSYIEHVKFHHDEVAKFYNRGMNWFVGVDIKETNRVVNHAAKLGIYTKPPKPVPLTDSADRPDREQFRR